MSDLNKMWAALEAYQPIADQNGHGESWKRMTQERTSEAADSAQKAAWDTNAYAACAAMAAMDVVKTEWRISRAIEHINQAMKEVQP